MAFYAMSKDFAVFKWFRAISEWGMLTISGENMIHDYSDDICPFVLTKLVHIRSVENELVVKRQRTSSFGNEVSFDNIVLYQTCSSTPNGF